MDQTDKRILQVLQTDGKLQNNELAQRIGLSASPCLRRVRQLEEDGIIRAYVALVDPAKVNLRLTV
ncbi:MAG: Lrp/AsnC family transcriptional regulator, partial [Proteobacteria bacterium]|nr:Lrp/AsnC family transcriptional regulator [Pseudomonadota bacterium]